jgi:hypothetical protein
MGCQPEMRLREPSEVLSFKFKVLSFKFNSPDTFAPNRPHPQPFLLNREKGSRIEVPLPVWERDLG